MPEIKILPKHIAELIAAGEVVERPASVIKELLENAVDAGATAVTAEIKNGGVVYMRVTDNGCGIGRDEVRTAFLPHATSKIGSEDDLSRILTLGFRGEALASVAAVARVEMLTAAADGEGTRYVIEGGEETLLEEAGCPTGTTVIVRDLFYNTPARMKFLKKDVSEGNSVAGVLDRLALSRPEVAFRLIRDGKQVLNSPGDGKLWSAVYAVFGREFADSLLPVEHEQNGIRVSGFVSKPSAARPNRNMQFEFLNGRFVKSRTVGAALEQAFKGTVMTGKFPSAVLHIELNAELADINVHPAKLEVRFADERRIFDAVYRAVKPVVEQGNTFRAAVLQSNEGDTDGRQTGRETWHENSVALVAPQAPKSVEPTPKQQSMGTSGFWKRIEEPNKPLTLNDPAGNAVPGITVNSDYIGDKLSDASKLSREKPQTGRAFPAFSPRVNIDITVDEDEENDEPPEAYAQREKPSEPGTAANRQDNTNPKLSGLTEDWAETYPTAVQEEAVPYRVIGEAFSTYIIVECGERLVFIDQHAAHERLLFERLLDGANGDAQQLLTPIAVTMTKEEHAALLQNAGLLAPLGFELEDFGQGACLVRAVPFVLAGGDVSGALIEIAEGFSAHKGRAEASNLEWLYHSVACRAAVKAGNKLKHEELLPLAQAVLEENSTAKNCPHGRPTAFVLLRGELEKQFGRV
ncbi:MAG: DNA mismatch repair endonuclease MutL [Oscillospiraceae bacterium]|jgi:DNA mismatch repair protein MutL|nr:DNA mismatch repair endonuclease MutL [Oscillospiraceae bacterium]